MNKRESDKVGQDPRENQFGRGDTQEGRRERFWSCSKALVPLHVMRIARDALRYVAAGERAGALDKSGHQLSAARFSARAHCHLTFSPIIVVASLPACLPCGQVVVRHLAKRSEPF